MPWQRLYFFPEPQGHSSFRPTFPQALGSSGSDFNPPGVAVGGSISKPGREAMLFAGARRPNCAPKVDAWPVGFDSVSNSTLHKSLVTVSLKRTSNA